MHIHSIHKKISPLAALLTCLALTPFTARADLQADLTAANQALGTIMPQAEALLADGKIDEANATILNTFPEPSRTPAQAFMLANILFSNDPKISYTLHKRAAADFPNEPDVQLEWAMEQHRAGEFAGAADAYAQFAKANPTFAPVFGLMAECLIRTGKIREAVDAWQHSETAPNGKLEQLESWVCEVHTHHSPHVDRAALLVTSLTGNIDSAEKLILLDIQFPRDWWKNGPQVAYLKKDLATLRTLKFADDQRLAQLLCAGDCALAAEAENPITDILKKNNLLVDDQATLPQRSAVLSSLLNSALNTHVLTKAQARDKWGQSILKAAQAAKDPELFNVAANLYLNTDQLPGIDRQAWELTGDPRFAESLLIAMEGAGTLKRDDPLLMKATTQYPEDANLAGIVLRLTIKEGKPLQSALINAIKAEYTHFSPNGILLRPSAAALRSYFKLLGQELPPP